MVAEQKLQRNKQSKWQVYMYIANFLFFYKLVLHEIAQKTLDLFLPGAFNWGCEAHDVLEKTFEVMHDFARACTCIGYVCRAILCPIAEMMTLSIIYSTAGTCLCS